MQTSRPFLLVLLVAAALPVFAARPYSPDEPLNNSRGNVIVAYGRISEVSGSERGRLYSTMSPTMQADLWILHLQYFLEDHEQLTPRQRAVIYDAIRFLASGVLSIKRDDPEWQTKVQEPSKQLESRMKMTLGYSLAREATAHLGHPEPYIVSVTPVGQYQESHASRFIPKPLNATCECAAGDDWCCVGDCLTSSTPRCHAGLYECIETRGCGWFWQDACDGMCGA